MIQSKHKCGLNEGFWTDPVSLVNKKERRLIKGLSLNGKLKQAENNHFKTSLAIFWHLEENFKLNLQTSWDPESWQSLHTSKSWIK